MNYVWLPMDGGDVDYEVYDVLIAADGADGLVLASVMVEAGSGMALAVALAPSPANVRYHKNFRDADVVAAKDYCERACGLKPDKHTVYSRTGVHERG